MDNYDDIFCKRESIPYDVLLSLVPDLPVRFVNKLRNYSFYSEEEFLKKVDELYFEYSSHFLFPNRLMAFYPQVIERVASKELTCNLSGARIKVGSFYYTYHPFIEDIKSGRVYTIRKKINAELGFIDYFPQNLHSYEEWYYKLKNSYYQNGDIIDFYFLSRECGENCLDPYLLGVRNINRKKKVKKKRKKEVRL